MDFGIFKVDFGIFTSVQSALEAAQNLCWGGEGQKGEFMPAGVDHSTS